MLRNVGLRKSVEQPVLDLNFAASQIGSNGAPDSRIDFSRGTNAWFVDSDGLVKKSPHNLITQSEDFSTTWTTAGTVNTNTHIAPDGTTTADTVSGDGDAPLFSPITVTAGTVYSLSVFFNQTNSTAAHLRFRVGYSGGAGSLFLNISSLVFGTASAVFDDAQVVEYGNGWYRASVKFTTPSGITSINWSISGVDADNSGTPDGDLVIWGAQVSQHTTLPVGNPYVKTEGSAAYAARLDHDPTWFMSAAQEQNLFLYSEMVDDTYWTKTNASVTANAATDPLGGTTAEELVENTANSTHFVASDEQFSVTNGTQYTFSAYVKRGSGERDVRLWFTGQASAFAGSTAIFDLGAGTVDNESCDAASIEDVGNGWFRVSATETATATTGQPDVRINLVNNASSYTGDGASSLFIWGIQLEVGSTASTYHRTEGAPYYGPGATPKGLLIEEQRANLVGYSEDFSASGLNPAQSPGGSLTLAHNDALAPDGTTTATKLVATSSGGSSGHLLYKVVSIDNDTTVTASVFMKNAGQGWGYLRLANTGYVSTKNAYADLENGVLGASSDSSATIEDYGNGWYRVSVTNTTDSDGGNDVVAIGVANGDAVTVFTGDDTNGIYIWGWQQEVGTFPTSYIQTTGSSATRNADVAVMGPTTGGTELVTNGTFDTDTTGWTAGTTSGTTATVSSGVVTISASTASGAGMFYQSAANTPTVIGRRYRATAELSVVSGSGVSLVVYSSFFSGLLGSSNITSGTDRTVTVDFTATTTATHIAIQRLTSYADTDEYKVDNVSVRELYPFEQYNPSEGTFQLGIEIDSHDMSGAINPIFSIGPSDAIIDISNEDDTSYVWVWSGDDNDFYLRSTDGSGTVVANIPLDSVASQPYAAGRTKVVAFGIKEDDYIGVGNKLNAGTDTSVSIAKVDSMRLSVFRSDLKFPNVHWKFVRYYPHRASEATLKSLIRDYDDT